MTITMGRRGVGLRAVGMAVIVAAAAVANGASAPAIARELCKRPTSALGQNVRGEANARASVIAAWQRLVAEQYGRRFADYYYSGDRSFACTWDDRGIRYRCGVTASPCG